MAVISITPEYPPGVRTIEISGPRPIPAVGTACAGFVGFVPNVKPEDVGKPILITNWTQFVKNFARTKHDDSVEPHLDGYYLSHAVYGFFQNGGGRCYVAGFNEPSPTDVPEFQNPITFQPKIPMRLASTYA